MRKLLIVVDMQKDFINGSLGTKEAEAIVEKVVSRIRAYPKEDVLLTMDTHPENYLETQEGKNLPVKHCIKGTEGWKLDPRIAEAAEGCRIFEKPSFGSGGLYEYLSGFAPGGDLELEFAGLCTDICEVSNALMAKAAVPEAIIRARKSCMAGVTPMRHEAALEVMGACQIRIEE